jgi:hypothetical protein
LERKLLDSGWKVSVTLTYFEKGNLVGLLAIGSPQGAGAELCG